MADYREAFVGIDVAKLKNAIAVAESGRDGEIRYFGEVDASEVNMRRYPADCREVRWCAFLLRGRPYGLRPSSAHQVAVLYIDAMRSLPSLIVLVIIYFALPFVGITLSPFVAAILALALIVSAYTAEICRAGIEAIPKGQFEAAAALGLPFVVVMWKVILPQAIRIVIPPLISNAISALKETSIASVVATPDLLKMALDTQAQNANPTPLIGAALIYLIVLWPLVKFGARIEGVPKLKQAH